MKPTIVVFSGTGLPAVSAANVYFKRLTLAYDVVLVEERSVTPQRVFKVLRSRLKREGLASVLDFLALRAWSMTRPHPAPTKRYEPVMEVPDLNTQEVAAFVRERAPALVITNACSILKAELIVACACPIINLHNGVTPRYRGSGNVWALAEDNMEMLGTTVHLLDVGIDTGGRLAVKPLAPDGHVTPEALDVASFIEGAHMVCEYVLEGQATIAPAFRELVDGYYSYPALSTYLRARRNLRRHLNRRDTEAIWRKSFQDLARDESKNRYERMHWSESATVEPRDALVSELYQALPAGERRVIDVGCGDGRYQHLLAPTRYLGCDFSLATLRLGGLLAPAPPDAEVLRPDASAYLLDGGPALVVEADARALPCPTSTFDVGLAVGLFQHLQGAQLAADELRRVVRPGGDLIVNTLRQFSKPELLAILVASLFNREQFQLALAIWRRDYFGGRTIGGTLVARRYGRRELLALFKARPYDVEVRYGGLGGTWLFSREITLRLRNTKKKL